MQSVHNVTKQWAATCTNTMGSRTQNEDLDVMSARTNSQHTVPSFSFSQKYRDDRAYRILGVETVAD